ncbi:MAG: flagellin [Pseudodesulfovibrio sp.]
MSLVINHNLMAMNAQRNLTDHYGRLGTSTRRLSSGLRVGTAADDAAGLAIRELMRSEISSLHQGIRNASDAISLVQTADGALQVIDEKLIRMKELAMQASTGTYNSDQRLIIDSEYQAMASEITRIASSTDFNGIYLLNGNLSSSTHNGSGIHSSGALKVHFGTGNDSAEDYYYIQIGGASASSLGLGSITSAQYQAANLPNHNVGGTQDLATWFATYPVPASVEAQFDLTSDGDFYSLGTDEHILATDTDGNLHDLTFANMAYVSDETIGGAGSTISTQALAQSALNAINNAIISKDKIRANLGATQNRLENTITNLEIQAENLQAAESRISDVDVAFEMTEFVRNQILTQSAVAMLAQANSLPRMAMQLIGG